MQEFFAITYKTTQLCMKMMLVAECFALNKDIKK